MMGGPGSGPRPGKGSRQIHYKKTHIGVKGKKEGLLKSFTAYPKDKQNREARGMLKRKTRF
jgi:hypothetical protein